MMDNNWPMVKLGEKLTERKEKPDLEAILMGEIAIVAKIGFDSGKIELREEGKTKTNMILIKPGDLVISGINAAKGAIAIYGEDNKKSAAATIHYSSYEINKGKADSLYLWYFLRSKTFRNILLRNLPKGIKTEVKQKRLLSIEIPFPDIEEQKRIVAKIESLMKRIEETRRLRAKTSEETETCLNQTREKIFKHALKSKEKMCLDKVALLERGKFSHRPRNDLRFFGGEHPWIQIEEIESSNKYIKAWNQTLNDEGLKISRKFRKGTVLISIAATIGAVGILNFDCCIPDSIVALTPKEGIESEYLYHYLQYLRTHLEEIAPRSAQKNINLKILSPLPVPLLSTFEQQSIVAYLDSLRAKVDELKRLQAETEKDLEELVPSILDRAFKGGLW